MLENSLYGAPFCFSECQSHLNAIDAIGFAPNFGGFFHFIAVITVVSVVTALLTWFKNISREKQAIVFNNFSL
jgi:hypothetical protein